MSQVAVAPKAAKSAAASETKGETLREVQPKRFPPSDFYPTGQAYEILHVTAGPDWTWEDVLKPVAWAVVAYRVSKDALGHRNEMLHSTVYVHGPNFFGMLNIDGVYYDQLGNPNGLKVSCIGPMQDLETGEACPIDLKTRRPLVPSKAAKAAA
jgi:hypothetical protein